MQIVRFILLTLLLVSCAPRGTIALYPGASKIGDNQRIYIGTTRELNEKGFPTGQRSRKLVFGRADVSIPKNREPGSIEWPGHQKPDPEKHFLVDNFQHIPSAEAFKAALKTDLRTRRKEGRTALIFVHGFNNKFSEGLYRLAQMDQDFGFPFLSVHYSWPSAGHPLGYGYDRDSMLIARDGLETLIRTVADSGVNEIILVGHSMGALLTMETMRQMAIEDGRAGLRKVGGVILISPDIDIDVFRQQAKRIGKLPEPFFIFTSTRDIALRLSAGLTGQADRLGNTEHIEKLADLNVTMVDISAFSAGGLEHSTALDSPAFIRLLRQLPNLADAYSDDPASRVGLIPGTVLVVQNATRLIVPNVR